MCGTTMRKAHSRNCYFLLKKYSPKYFPYEQQTRHKLFVKALADSDRVFLCESGAKVAPDVTEHILLPTSTGSNAFAQVVQTSHCEFRRLLLELAVE